ncbi:hypothetical protein C0Q70_08210 [Pomacea canaliculata]|uniref:Uncharacterized protein n=1 Tax=Pomacea canaliculata TaxID=400727 RepID=A0A2T7PH65_POMCA|nr:hypothetical protein C0Q70_08210 [Pomacea canaliculata]
MSLSLPKRAPVGRRLRWSREGARYAGRVVPRPRPNPLLADNSQARKSEKGQNSHKGDNAGPAPKLGSTPTGRRGLTHRDAAFDQAPGPLA